MSGVVYIHDMPRSRRRSRPAVTAATAAARITARRADVRDQPDPPDDLLGVVAHVHRWRRGLPPGTLRADVADGLTILDHLAAELDRHRLALIRAAREDGATWQDIAAWCGLDDRRAAYDLARRLEASAAGGTKNAREAYAAERARQDERRAVLAQVGQARELARTVVAGRDQLPDDLAADVDEIAAVAGRVAAGEAGAAGVLVARLRLLAGEVADLPGVDAKLRAALVGGTQRL